MEALYSGEAMTKASVASRRRRNARRRPPGSPPPLFVAVVRARWSNSRIVAKSADVAGSLDALDRHTSETRVQRLVAERCRQRRARDKARLRCLHSRTRIIDSPRGWAARAFASVVETATHGGARRGSRDRSNSVDADPRSLALVGSWETFADILPRPGFDVSAPEWPRKEGDVAAAPRGRRRARRSRHDRDRRPLRVGDSQRSTSRPS